MNMTLTAYGSTFLKAVEALTDSPQRLFEDEYSIRFLPFAYRLAIRLMRMKFFYRWMINLREKMTPGLLGAILCRNRYIDDVLKSSIADAFEAVVNLGAGFDTRAFRIPGITNMEIIEVDHPAVLEEKRNRMRKSGMQNPANLVFVPVDFDTQSLEDELKDSGYKPELKTIFIMEGVTQYITKEAFRSTIEYISKSAPGSRLVFTYALKDILANAEYFPDSANLARQFKTFGFTSMSSYTPGELIEILAEYGIFIKEDVGAEDYQERYLQPLHRSLPVLPLERVLYAEVCGKDAKERIILRD